VSFLIIVEKLGYAVVLIVASILRLSIRGVKLGAKLYHKYCSQYSQAALQSWLQQVQYMYLYFFLYVSTLRESPTPVTCVISACYHPRVSLKAIE